MLFGLRCVQFSVANDLAMVFKVNQCRFRNRNCKIFSSIRRQSSSTGYKSKMALTPFTSVKLSARQTLRTQPSPMESCSRSDECRWIIWKHQFYEYDRPFTQWSNIPERIQIPKFRHLFHKMDTTKVKIRRSNCRDTSMVKKIRENYQEMAN